MVMDGSAIAWLTTMKNKSGHYAVPHVRSHDYAWQISLKQTVVFENQTHRFSRPHYALKKPTGTHDPQRSANELQHRPRQPISSALSLLLLYFDWMFPSDPISHYSFAPKVDVCICVHQSATVCRVPNIDHFSLSVVESQIRFIYFYHILYHSLSNAAFFIF